MQVADVSKPLQSVRAMMAADHAVIFDTAGSFAISKTTGEVTEILDDGTNFKMIQFVVPEAEVEGLAHLINEGSDFIRQE